MSKPPTKTILRVFEFRYERGYRYLDRCGEVMLILEEVLAGVTEKIWMTKETRPTGAQMSCPELDVVLVIDSLRFSLEQSPCEAKLDFDKIASITAQNVCNRFEVTGPIRLGYRQIDIAGTDSIDDANKLSVRQLPMGWPLASPKGMSITEMDTTTVFRDEAGCGVKLNVAPAFSELAPVTTDPRLKTAARLLSTGQREALLAQSRSAAQRTREPQAGLVFDIDVFQERPNGNPPVTEWLRNAQSLHQDVFAAAKKARGL